MWKTQNKCRFINKNIEFFITCKYSKYMSDSIEQDKKSKQEGSNSQVLKGSIFIKEDDQDWGSSGMNNIQEESE